jgi:RNA-directed DNA polymerase
MDAATWACASSGVTWDGISWADVRRQVRRLQARIVKATQDGRHNKVKALQWLLTHSFSGKALAVKRVTENNVARKSVVKQGIERCLWEA